MAKRRPSGDGMVRKREDGRWEGRIVVGHKDNGDSIFRYVYADTQKELTARLRKCITAYQGVDLTEQSRLTLSEWLDQWLVSKEGLVRPGTLNGYRGYIENHIRPHLGEKRISQIKAADIQRFYDMLSRKLASGTVRRIHTTLHGILKAAAQARLIPRNPVEEVTPPKFGYQEKKVLTAEQVDRLMEAIQKDALWHDLFYTELTTGLRRGELCGLRWEDFDAASGSLKVCRTVRREKGKGLTTGDTKTYAGTRTITLPPSLAALLKERKRAAKTAWIFPDLLRPERPTAPDAAYRRMKLLLEQAGLPDIRFHDLRHTFATHALTSGVDVKTLKDALAPPAPPRIKADMPFGDWMEYWYETQSRPAARPGTRRIYEGCLRLYIRPGLGHIPLNRLTAKDMQRFFAWLKTEGRADQSDGETGLADSQLRNIHSLCRRALEKAVSEDLIPQNPASGCKLPPARKGEMNVLSRESMQKLLIQAKEEKYYELFLLEFATGLRLGELTALQWEDLNLTTGELRISKQAVVIGSEVVVTEPKTKAAVRTLLLPPKVLEVFREYRKRNVSRWLFPSPKKEDSPLLPSVVRQRLHRLLDHAGCERVRFHDLRHTFATNALAHGMDIKTLSTILGHVSAATTLNTYSHITEEMRRQAAAKIDAGIANIIPTMPMMKKSIWRTLRQEKLTAC